MTDYVRSEAVRRVAQCGLAAALLLTTVAPSAAQELLVSTHAGIPGSGPVVDGPAGVGRLGLLNGMVAMPDGTLFVTENTRIRRVGTDGAITTLVGTTQQAIVDGPAADARFTSLRGIDVGPDGNFYVGDQCTVRRVTPTGDVTTLAGSPSQCVSGASDDGVGGSARFGIVEDVVVGAGGLVYAIEDRRIRVVTRTVDPGDPSLVTWVVTTLAGTGGPTFAIVDGEGGVARFIGARSATLANDGNIYVAEWNPGVVRRVTPGGLVTTIAGPGPSDSSILAADAVGAAAKFRSPLGIAFDAASNALFVADSGNHTIRRVDLATNAVTTVASVTQPLNVNSRSGYVDGLGAAVRFSTPMKMQVGPGGVLYVNDTNNYLIRAAVEATGVPAGANPTANLSTSRGTVTLSFTDVTVGGAVVARVVPSDPTLLGAPPFGNRFVPTAHFDVTSTAAFTALTLCLPFDATEVAAAGLTPAELRLFHRPTGASAWADVTSSVDLGASRVCGNVTSLSPFAIGGPAVAAFTRYLAEGATSDFFDTQIALLNPGHTGTTATLTFLPGGGAPPVVHVVPVPARTRATVDPKTLPGLAAAEFSTVVESDELLIVDRTMSWDASGYGSHAETAVAAPATTWYLAEGATHSGFSLFYLLQNPSSQATTVRVRYLRTAGGPLEKEYVLPPASRTNIWVNVEEFPGMGAALASAEFSAVVESLDSTPIIVERAMYRSNQGRLFNAGHESMGVTTPSTQWFLAEGATGAYFDLFVLIANPTDTDAAVKLTYLLGNGQTFTRETVAPANQRSGVWVDVEQFDGIPGFPLADVAVSTLVESTNSVPLIVERAMWWPGDFTTWHEAHNSAGATATGTLWALAEGEVGGARGHETYILIANTSAVEGSATVTLLFDDGTSADVTYTLPANSRTNVPVALDFPQAAGRRFGAIVASTGGTPAQIVVERAMYSNAGGVTWAAGTNALATRLH